MTYVFSFSLKKRVCDGDRGRRKYEEAPNKTVKRPSRIKIHAHPGRLPIPSMLIIPKARRPENAPDIEVAEKKADILK